MRKKNFNKKLRNEKLLQISILNKQIWVVIIVWIKNNLLFETKFRVIKDIQLPQTFLSISLFAWLPTSYQQQRQQFKNRSEETADEKHESAN